MKQGEMLLLVKYCTLQCMYHNILPGGMLFVVVEVKMEEPEDILGDSSFDDQLEDILTASSCGDHFEDNLISTMDGCNNDRKAK